MEITAIVHGVLTSLWSRAGIRGPTAGSLRFSTTRSLKSRPAPEYRDMPRVAPWVPPIYRLTPWECDLVWRNWLPISSDWILEI